jgi:hypothetical protein
MKDDCVLKDRRISRVKDDPRRIIASREILLKSESESVRVEQVTGNDRGVASSENVELDHTRWRANLE